MGHYSSLWLVCQVILLKVSAVKTKGNEHNCMHAVFSAQVKCDMVAVCNIYHIGIITVNKLDIGSKLLLFALDVIRPTMQTALMYKMLCDLTNINYTDSVTWQQDR